MKQYIVDAFTDQVFHGNQAAICVMDEWIPETLMMDITRENNFSETAFTVKEGEKYHLRWFTPGGEIDLCGHATLACAYVLLRFYIPKADSVTFTTLSGDLIVTWKEGGLLEMDFPAYDLKPVPVTDEMEAAIGIRPREAYMGRDLLCVLDDAAAVRNVTPDLEKVKALDGLLLHVTAPGISKAAGDLPGTRTAADPAAEESGPSAAGGPDPSTSTPLDSVSRTFAPKLAVAEDPVCGSGHCHIVPYWADRLGKADIVAYQASRRGGTLYCRYDKKDQKVFLAGQAVLFSEGELQV